MDQRARELAEAPNFGHVATLRHDGTPHTVLVWVDVDDGQLSINTARGRDWHQNVERDPRVEVLVANSANPYEYARFRGRLIEADDGDADAQIDRLAKKYLGQDSYPFRQEGEERVKLLLEADQVKVIGAG